MKIGKTIRFLRCMESISQTKLAQKSGIAISSLCDIEAGRNNPSIKVLTRIAHALNMRTYNLVKICEVSALSSNSNYHNGKFPLFKNKFKDMDTLISLLKGFKNWPVEEKKELFNYLKNINQ